ncbi:tRNA pseudouridine(13) synthase TruD [Pseudohongiella spirulinae]|nr:tRNA pseudouridine(13) synthase TruD [Pseudohongiella spirulinae]
MHNLPRAYGQVAVQGLFKQRPEDFRVTEQLGFTCSGEGEHLWVRIQKIALNTVEVADRLARAAGVSNREVSYSGLKDRQGVCSQWFSIHNAALRPEQLRICENDNLRIMEVVRNGRKLRRGAHKGNSFYIRIRQLSGSEYRQNLLNRLMLIQQGGVPNYFGEQRFGYDNLNKATALFEGKVGRISRHQRGLLLSSARSALFNVLLANRVETGTWNSRLSGDVFNLEGTASVFADEQNDPKIDDRLAELDIHPTGPMWGAGELKTQGEAKALEEDLLAHWPIYCQGLQRLGLKQERRSLRLAVKSLHYCFCADDSLELSFNLPTGTYATAVLHELLGYQTQK